MTLVFLVLTGLLLAAFLVILRRVVRVADMPATVRERARKMLPALGSGVWIGYAWLVLFVLFGEDAAYPYISGSLIFVLAALLGWYVLRDIVAGIAFVTKNPNILNHRLAVLGLEGKVIRLGPTNIHLQTDTGETVSIPYSRVAGEVFTDHSHTFLSEQFSVSLTIDQPDDPETFAATVRDLVVLLPWTNARHSPTVKISDGDDGAVADVTYHCLNDRHADLIEQHLRKTFARKARKSSPKAGKKKKTTTRS